MGDDKVLGQDFEVPTPTAGAVNVTADSLTELQAAGLTDEQAAALDEPTPVDPRSPLFGEAGVAAVEGDEAADAEHVDADEVEPFDDEAPAENVGNADNDAVVALAPDANEDDEPTGPMPTLSPLD